MKKIIILLLATGAVFFSGCHAVRDLFVRKPFEEVVQNSYPIQVNLYEVSVLIKATPGELDEYISDISGIQKASSKLGVANLEIEDLGMKGPVLQLGQSMAVTVKILGLSLRSRAVVFKYKPEQELWLMVMTEDYWSWLLARIKIEPVKEGSIVSVSSIGRPTEQIGDIIDTFKLVEAVAGQIDLWLAYIQSEFDPEVNVKDLTGRGLRGELYHEFIQAYEASIWINSSPEKVAQWLIKESETYMPEIRIKGDCNSFNAFNQISAHEVKYCPASYEFGILEGDLETFLIWMEKNNKRIYRIYLQGMGQFGLIRFITAPEAGGCRLSCFVAVEIPGSAAPRVMELMVAIADIPQRLNTLISAIKHGVEGTG